MRLSIVPLFVSALFVAACDRQSEPPPQPKQVVQPQEPVEEAIEIMGPVDRTNKGNSMPDVAFLAPNGDTVKLSDFVGQPTLVNLWATWCAPCLAEMPALDRLAKRETGALQVLTISQDMKGRAAVDRWWKDQSLTTLQPYTDPRTDLSFAYGGVSLPTTILYDGAGKEVWRVTGASDWDGEAAKGMIAEAGER